MRISAKLLLASRISKGDHQNKVLEFLFTNTQYSLKVIKSNLSFEVPHLGINDRYSVLHL